MITQERLIHLLDYNPETGVFKWKNPNNGPAKKGAIAGCIHNNGYVKISLHSKQYLAHRLAWLYVYGEWPSKFIDHINGKKYDNRIDNLREASRKDNVGNMFKVTSSTGFKGVTKNKSNFKAELFRSDGTSKHIGTFYTPEDAALAYDDVAKKYFGEFARTNKDLGLLDHLPDDYKSMGNVRRNLIKVVKDGKITFKTTKSGLIGVHQSRDKWEVNIKINGKRIFRKKFECKFDAAKKYDEIITRIFGDDRETNASLGLI